MIAIQPSFWTEEVTKYWDFDLDRMKKVPPRKRLALKMAVVYAPRTPVARLLDYAARNYGIHRRGKTPASAVGICLYRNEHQGAPLFCCICCNGKGMELRNTIIHEICHLTQYMEFHDIEGLPNMVACLSCGIFHDLEEKGVDLG